MSAASLTTPPAEVMKARGRHDDIKAHIVDKRLVIAIETDESAQLDERLVQVAYRRRRDQCAAAV
jgi:hypothetical protein